MITRSPHQDLDDQTLATRVAEGDRGAFTLLFERHKGSVYRFCRLMIGDDDAAKDVYQDVFISLFRACAAGQTMHNVRGYLMTAARTRSLNVIRRTQRIGAIDEAPEPWHEIDPSTGDTNSHLERAMTMIPPQYREALLLFEYEGFSYEEIATQIEVSHDVVKNRIYRAKQALQRILRPILREDDKPSQHAT